jgi:high-affinity nickel permease
MVCPSYITSGCEYGLSDAAGLDADHISAIDNATRQLVSLGQLPITCGGYSEHHIRPDH